MPTFTSILNNSDTHVGMVSAIPSRMISAQIGMQGDFLPTDTRDTNRGRQWAFSNTILNVIVTDFAPTEQVNASITTTLSDDIYLYVCGDKMGSFNLAGTAYSIYCDGTLQFDPSADYDSSWSGFGNFDTNQAEHGLSRMLKFYRYLKLSSNSGLSVLTFSPGISVSGYLVGFTGGGYNADLDTFDFSMSYLMPPEVSPNRLKTRNN